MWCPEGYVTLFEVSRRFARAAFEYAVDTKNPLEIELGANTPFSVRNIVEAYEKWLMCMFLELLSDEVRVCLPSGNLVRPDMDIFEAIDDDLWPPDEFGDSPYIFSRKCYDLLKLRFRYVDYPSMHILEPKPGEHSCFQAIAGAPLCVAEARLPVGIEGLADWLIQESTRLGSADADEIPDRLRSKELAERICNAFNSGQVRTKGEARQLFGRGMKHIVWQTHWLEACTINPELAKPGPRTTGNRKAYSE